MKCYCSVAGLPFAVHFLPSCAWDMPHNYSAFVSPASSSVLFSLRVQGSAASVARLSRSLRPTSVATPFLWSSADSFGSVFAFSFDASSFAAVLHLGTDGAQPELYLAPSVSARHFQLSLDHSLMLLFALYAAPHQALLVHASVVVCQGEAHAFLAPSGTGKSTHVRFWLRHLPHTSLLNDDNPVVRFVGGRPVVYGSPWSGDSPCHLNRSCPLRSLVRLFRHPSDEVTPLSGAAAFAAFLPSCTCLPAHPSMSSLVADTLAQVLSTCSSFRLRCRPHAAAALLCHAQIAK